jgi:hypothetical protein
MDLNVLEERGGVEVRWAALRSGPISRVPPFAARGRSRPAGTQVMSFRYYRRGPLSGIDDLLSIERIKRP